jgi:hypothetical protein
MTSKDKTRRELLDQIATAPEHVIERLLSVAGVLITCPEWCIESHRLDDSAVTWHSSQATRFATSDLALTYDPGEEDAPRVRVNDDKFSADEARQIAAELLRLADLIGPGSAPLAVAQ